MRSIDSVRADIRVRAYGESALALVTGVLAIVTVFWRDWIEALTGYDPDHHSGSVEWLIIAGLALVCLVASLTARSEWRRARVTSAPLVSNPEA